MIEARIFFFFWRGELKKLNHEKFHVLLMLMMLWVGMDGNWAAMEERILEFVSVFGLRVWERE